MRMIQWRCLCDTVTSNITAVRTVDKGLIVVPHNECLERLKIHAVPVERYMGKGTDGLQNMQQEFEE